MAWGHCGTDDQGREIGYCIEATCDQPGCTERIDRGLSYVCGGMHGGGEHGCGGYFCTNHLGCSFSWPPAEEMSPDLCESCLKAWAASHP